LRYSLDHSPPVSFNGHADRFYRRRRSWPVLPPFGFRSRKGRSSTSDTFLHDDNKPAWKRSSLTMAFEFLKPILTPNALATVQANPILLAYFLGWLLACISIGLLAWYISFTTGKAYRKPQKQIDEKKGLLGRFRKS
jgi:hypothetical protein